MGPITEMSKHWTDAIKRDIDEAKTDEDFNKISRLFINLVSNGIMMDYMSIRTCAQYIDLNRQDFERDKSYDD